jgi:hypothetical protein
MAQVPFVKSEVIEQRAKQLLQAYAVEEELARIEPPIPIDAIIQNVLNLPFDIDDVPTMMAELLLQAGVARESVPDLTAVLGATFMDGEEGHIFVDQTLEAGPTGRLDFTMAHEVGHWILHRPLHLELGRQGDLFARREPSTILCRGVGEFSTEKKPRGESQADRFAGALLMPEDLVRWAFRDLIGNNPVVLGTAEAPVEWSDVIGHPDARGVARQLQSDAGFTNVSVSAMVVRLNQLGLVRGAPDENRSLAFQPIPK